MYLPSGDQAGSQANLLSPIEILRGVFNAFLVGDVQGVANRLSLSENQAICFPSGDQKGRRSAAPELRVRFLGRHFQPVR